MRWIIWSIAVFFYFYEFFLRVFPSIIVNDLISFFHIDASGVGVLSAFYFYIYALMQLPVGLLLDKYGARRLLTLGSLSCGLGGVLFGIATSLSLAEFSRFLQGFGSAFAFLGMVYICSHWFKPSKLALLVGIGNSIGAIGAAMGEGPLSLLTEKFGWNKVIFILGIIGIILACVIAVIIRNDPKKGKNTPKKLPPQPKVEIGYSLKTVMTNWQSWIAAFISFAFLVSVTSFAGLWGVPFIQEAYNVSKPVAGFAISAFFIGIVVGGPIIGHYSDRVKQRKHVLTICGLASAILMYIIIFFPHFSIYLVYLLFFLVGVFSAAQPLAYCLAIEVNPRKIKGTSIALTNFITYLLGSLSQPFIGMLLDMNWKGVIKNGIPYYSVSDYQSALLFFPIMFALGALASLFINEKGKHEPYAAH